MPLAGMSDAKRLEVAKSTRQETEALARRMYGDHPYATDLPLPADVRTVTAKQLIKVHSDFVRPSDAVLVIVGVRKGGHDFIAHGFDDGALVLLRRGSHDIDADGHHIPGPQIAHQLIEPCGAHDISEENGQLDIFSHAPIRRGAVLRLS